MGLCSRRDAGFNAWRRPTLPGLEPQYHRRSLVSRPSSGWDRVGHRRYDHQAMKRASRCVWFLIDAPIWGYVWLYHPLYQRLDCSTDVDGGTLQARIEQLVSVSSMRYRTSTSDLSTSWSLTALRNLILREASRLDAFSGYPVHT